MVLDQLLVTGQVNHYTSDGGASVYSIASYLVVRVGHKLVKPWLLTENCVFSVLGYYSG